MLRSLVGSEMCIRDRYGSPCSLSMNPSSTAPRRSNRLRNNKNKSLNEKENIPNCSIPKKQKQKKTQKPETRIESKDPFHTLQEDTADEVLQWLTPTVALQTGLVSTLWRKISSHRSLWASLKRRNPPGEKNGVYWRVYYVPTSDVDAGSGDEAKCYRVKERATGKIVLAKCVPVALDTGVSRWLLREAAILWNIGHSCIVKPLGSVVNNDEACLFFQDCGSTNLHRLACDGQHTDVAIDKGEPVSSMKVSLTDLRFHMFRILSAVAECHAQQIIHRNVKPTKFLVDKEGICWMTSFTSSLINGGCIAPRELMPRMGTTQYLAPEVLLGAKDLESDYTTYTEKVDIWSAGLILAEMAAGGPLFIVDSEIDLLFSIFRLLGSPSQSTWEGINEMPCSIEDFPSWNPKAPLREIFSVLGEDGCDLLSRMLQYDHKRRISALDALRHPFFTKHNHIFQTPFLTSVPPAMHEILNESQCLVWATLRKRESEMPILGDHLAKDEKDESNSRITPNMRSILVDWLSEISYSWFMRSERRALHCAVNCLDRYLANEDVSKDQLQLVGATCYSLAAKLEEAEVVPPAGYCSISDNAFTEEDMRQCEVAVAHSLQCRVALPTCPDFEPLIAETLALQNETEVWASSPMVLMAQMLNDAMLLGYHVGQQQWLPSIVTCSSFTIASLTIAKKIPTAILCKSEKERLVECIQSIYETVTLMKEKDWTHTFKNDKYLAVRDTPLVDMWICIEQLRQEL
eukprot:TRINITY_DN5162_c0_g1_i1.p1 TRINITY_DN5162_c0_g1~~TRINITY_DN5162_c0_g1_i1.p1  ORF type:complete len:745 (-),score=94.79 TRINITY_DN5162_c0_g1_i1:472-2706(-)